MMVRYIGEIISDDGREILVITNQVGKLYLNKSEISSITKIDEKFNAINNGEFRASGPFTTRYCFTNNALPLKISMVLFMFMDLKFI